MSGVHHDDRDSSNLTIALIIGYVRDRGGDLAVELLLEAAGETRPISELLDEGRWSSYRQKIRLFEAAIEVLGDPDTPRLVGTTVLERQTGAAIRLMLRALGSPASVCRSVAKASAKFSTNYTCEALSVGKDGAVISNRLHDGYEPCKVDCEYTAGLMSQIPSAVRARTGGNRARRMPGARGTGLHLPPPVASSATAALGSAPGADRPISRRSGDSLPSATRRCSRQSSIWCHLPTSTPCFAASLSEPLTPSGPSVSSWP